MKIFFTNWKLVTEQIKAEQEYLQWESNKQEEYEYMESEYAAENDMDSVYWCEACRIGVCEEKH